MKKKSGGRGVLGGGGLEMKDGSWMVDDDGGAGNVMVMGIRTQRCCVS